MTQNEDSMLCNENFHRQRIIGWRIVLVKDPEKTLLQIRLTFLFFFLPVYEGQLELLYANVHLQFNQLTI